MAESPAKNPKKSQQDRRTPPWLFEYLDAQFGPFELDAAASVDNSLCDLHFDIEMDATLKAARWRKKTFCNPPFRNMKRWVKKAINEAKRRKYFTLMLGPAGGSQEWFNVLARQYTILCPNKRINYCDNEGRPTGVGLGEPGADRDTTIMLIGPGFENTHYAVGAFRMYVLDLDAATKK